ncbi:MAG: hypothetical protein ACFFA6_10185 [Promethearchaeota archaeon]
MKHKKLLLLGSILFLLFPVTNTLAFTYVDSMKNGNYVFFLVDLLEGEDIHINVTRNENGNFTLFLFNKRPSQSYVKTDKTLNPKIFNISLAYSLDDNPYIYYNAANTRIYYIEIILISGGPDSFTLTCNKELTRYYLPIIPGYQLELLIFAIVFSIGLILILYRKRLKNSKSL